MASEARRRTTRYETYGSVAYDPVWEGGAAAVPGREEAVRPRPRVRPKERILARPRVQVREAGKVSPFAVVGFLSVGVLTALLLMSSVRLTVVNDETVQLRNQLTQLQEEEAKLLTQYELAYDLQEIEELLTADGTMVKPGSSQMIVLDLSEPDNVVVYDQKKDVSGALEKIGGLLDGLGS